jgi:hypothetical protein
MGESEFFHGKKKPSLLSFLAKHTLIKQHEQMRKGRIFPWLHTGWLPARSKLNEQRG